MEDNLALQINSLDETTSNFNTLDDRGLSINHESRIQEIQEMRARKISRFNPFGRSSIVAASIGLQTSIIGTGIMSLPSSIAIVGWFSALMLLMFSALAQFVTYYCLVSC